MKIVTSFILCLVLTACCDSDDDDRAELSDSKNREGVKISFSQVLRKGNGAEPQTLDPHKAEGVPAANILRDIYEGLVSETANGDLAPGVAERWEVNAAGTVYRFYLRKNARWSNGDLLTAEDFLYSFRRSVDPATGSRYSKILSSILNVEEIIALKKPIESLGISVIDQYSLEIKLKAPTPYFLALLTHSISYPVYRPSVEKYGAKFSRPGTLISNGAYLLNEWVIQSHIGLARNRHYWNNLGTRIDQVIYYAIEDQSSELKRYRANAIDWTESVPLGEIDFIRKNLNDELHISPYLGTYYYGFNLTKLPFKDNTALRKALSMAIDREIIVQKITRLGEIPAYGWVPPGVMDYAPQSLDFKSMDQDQRDVQAKRLYREAGFSAAEPLRIQIRYNTSENHKKVAIAVAAMWKKTLGVFTELINEEWKVFLSNRKLKDKTQVFRAGWIGDYNDAFSFAELMHSNHGINDVGYDNPRYDDLLARASLAIDSRQRRELLERAERLLLAEHPVIPIYFYVSKSLIKPYLSGFVGNIMDHHYTKNFRILKH